MSITVLPDVILPHSVISANPSGRTQRRNTRSVSQSGASTINVDWDRSLRQYTLGLIPMDVAAWAALEGIFEVTDGGAFGFLLQDPKDSIVSASQGVLSPLVATGLVGTAGLGYGVPVHRLSKVYTALGSPRTKVRTISRPLGTPALLRGGVPVVIGAAAGNAAVDMDTGAVTFVADASQAIASVTVGASTVLTFASGSGIVAALSVGQRVHLSGISGTAATTLNGLSHAITAKDAGLFTLTISTATTGLTATGGTAAKYPQASEALTWSGGFYVPVHFASDEIEWDLVRSGAEETRIVAGPQVLVQEILE